MTLTRQISVVLINCFAISIVSASIFYLNEPLTFNGYDGKYNFLKIALQGNWMPFQFGFGNNIFQELGNVFLSHNIYFFPGYLPGLFIQDIKLASPLIYMTHTLVGFVLTYLFSRTFESNTRHNMLCAWFMCFFSMPFFWPVMIYPITGMIPHLLQVICVIGLSISLFFSIGRNSRKSDVYRVFAIVFLMVLSTLSAPALTCLASPVVIVMGMVSVVFATQKERNRKLIALGVMLIILLPSVIPVLAGTILYTVPYFFLSELYSSQGGWSSVSILFHSKTWFAGPSIFVLSLAGCIYSLIKKMGKLKAVAISTIICKVMLLSIGAFIEWSARTPSVSLVNIETFLWPFYILFCSIIFSAALKLPFFQYSKFGVIFRKYIIILPIFVSVFQSLPNANKKFWDAWLYPPKIPDNMQILFEEISISENETFRGIVATFDGIGENLPVGWGTKLVSRDHKIHSELRNDLRGPGLWYFNIPTLFSYNQLMTPQFYLMATRILAYDHDVQTRNVIALSRINIPYLKSIGTRFILVDKLLTEPERLGYSLKSISRRKFEKNIYLYELSDPNIGQYSPTEQKKLISVDDMLDSLREQKINLEHTVFVEEEIGGQLTQGKNIDLKVLKSGLRIRGNSGGKSLIVLPLQYSNCLTVSEWEEANSKAKLIRVNLMQAGLVFQKKIDAIITFHFGFLNNPYCRLKDWYDFKKIMETDFRS